MSVERGIPVAIRPGLTWQRVTTHAQKSSSTVIVLDGRDDDGRQVKITLQLSELARLNKAAEMEE